MDEDALRMKAYHVKDILCFCVQVQISFSILYLNVGRFLRRIFQFNGVIHFLCYQGAIVPRVVLFRCLFCPCVLSGWYVMFPATIFTA